MGDRGYPAQDLLDRYKIRKWKKPVPELELGDNSRGDVYDDVR